MHKKFFDEDGKHIFDQEQYGFLFDESHPKYVGRPLSFLTVGGSIAYGTDVETSDVDIRGMALSLPEEILGRNTWEGMPTKKNKAPEGVDVVLYSYPKLFDLLIKCNPNILEVLCVDDQHVLIEDYAAKLVRDNHQMFLSRKALHGSFSGYSKAQLRRMQNKTMDDDYPQAEKEQHVMDSIKNLQRTISDRYQDNLKDEVEFKIIESDKAGFDKEIAITINLDTYPLRDLKGFIAETNNVIRDYEKLGNRNKKADPASMSKHIMHTIRPILMEIKAHRTGKVEVYMPEHIPFLREVRAGKFMNDDGSVKQELFDYLDELDAELQEAYENSVLPDYPDWDGINALLMEINKYTLACLDSELSNVL